MKPIMLQSGNYVVDDLLNGFEIKQLPSRNVQFIGINVFELSLYVQFLSGSAYLYKDIDMDTLQEADTCESIGKFVSAKIVKKFPAEKQERLLITPIFDPLLLSGHILNIAAKGEVGQIFILDEETEITYIEPQIEQEPEF